MLLPAYDPRFLPKRLVDLRIAALSRESHALNPSYSEPRRLQLSERSRSDAEDVTWFVEANPKRCPCLSSARMGTCSRNFTFVRAVPW